MKREKFIEDAKNTPSRFYRNPIDVIRDRRLTNEQRLEILAAWEDETRTHLTQETDMPGEQERLGELQRVREQLKGAA